MEPRHLTELIDACRPGSQDADMPEMRPLTERIEQDPGVRQRYERVQRLDAAIRTALEHVPLPEGLVGRLLAAVQPPAVSTSMDGVESAGTDTRVPGKTLAATERAGRTGLTGRWRVAAVLTGLAVAIAALIAAWPQNSDPLTEERMASRVSQWTASIDPGRWRGPDFPYRAFPPSSNVHFVEPRRWQPISGRPAERIVCYDLMLREGGQLPPGAGQLLLFILRTPQARTLPTAPRNVPRTVTRGWCVGSWQENGLVYALAVQGSGSLYQRLVPPPGIAAALGRMEPPG